MKSYRRFLTIIPSFRGVSVRGAASRIGSPDRLLNMLMNATLSALWVWLYRPIYPYLATIFSRQEFRTNQIVLAGVLILIVLQVRKGGLRPRLDAPLRMNIPALSLALGGSVIFVLLERFLDINTLSAATFGLATYGLLGLWMSPSRWRRGLPVGLLLVGALPIGEHLETFVGYPVRILSAAIVRYGLSILGVRSIGIDTILVFENGISQVDLPCSGVKSLWTGALFLIAATWIEGRSLNLRWFGVSLIFSLLLLIANLVRVGVLVTVGQVMAWQLVAEMLHVPLGVLGFIGACAGGLALLRWTGDAPRIGESTENEGKGSVQWAEPAAVPLRPPWLVPLLGGAVLILGLVYKPRPQESVPDAPQVWQFPADLAVEPWPLSDHELEQLSTEADSSATRWRFVWGDLTGSMLFVNSTSWRAQHRPERCFEVYGLSVDESQTYLVNTDFPLRLLTLDAGDDQGAYSAAYWFQSTDQVTDDYGTRIWADLTPKRQSWVLVTILLDGPIDPHNTDLLTLFPALRQTVAISLGGGIQP